MKKTNLVDSMNLIDNELIEEVLEIDSLAKYKEKKEKVVIMKKNRLLGMLVPVLAVACALMLVVNNQKDDKKADTYDPVQIVNPLVEYNSLEELEAAVEMKVPMLDKEAEAYVSINQNNENEKYSRIIYKDGSIFDMLKNIETSSDYGALEKEEVIEDITVQFYHIEEDNLAIWTINEYSYEYLVKGTVDSSELAQLVQLCK